MLVCAQNVILKSSFYHIFKNNIEIHTMFAEKKHRTVETSQIHRSQRNKF